MRALPLASAMRDSRRMTLAGRRNQIRRSPDQPSPPPSLGSNKLDKGFVDSQSIDENPVSPFGSR